MEAPSAGRRSRLAGMAGAVLCLLALLSAPAPAGATPLVLPDGRTLTPAGTMVSAGDFPAAAVLHGGSLLVADAGQGANDLLSYDTTTGATAVAPGTSSSPSGGEAPWAQSGGLALAPGGGTVWVAGGTADEVRGFSTAPTPVQQSELHTSQYAGGVAPSADGRRLFVTEPLDPKAPFGKGSSLAVIDTRSGQSQTVKVGRNPFAVIDGTVPGALGVAAGTEIVAVANRDDGTVSVLDATTLTPRALISTGRQPAALALTPDGRDLLVLDSLDDQLVDVSTRTWTVRGRTDLSRNGLGAAPSALAISSDGRTAYVALSADNAVAVLHPIGDGAWSLAGEIPTAQYPTAVALAPGGPLGGARTLLVTAGKGTGMTFATPPGLPLLASATLNPGPTGLGVSGAIESIPVPASSQLAADTQAVLRNNQPACTMSTRGCRPSPALRTIKHVVYIIRENKTYDEEFGDQRGGSPAGLLYGRQTTPNTHALADRFALLESFYANEEVSDTGHQAVMGGVANDWVQRLSQQAYGLDAAPRQGAELGNDSDLLWSPGNYLLDNALAHGISFRDYGEFFRRNQSTDAALTPALNAHIDHNFPGFGFDPNYPDTGRVAYWVKQFQHDVAARSFPSLEVIYLPYDHTTYGLPPTPLPQQQVADSDLATGQVVDALSRSPYWSSTAVFLTEDDPQGGVDHVDAHRTIGLVVSPHVHAGAVTRHFDQAGMLRTIEEILGLPPLTEFDATALPMDSLFTRSLHAGPYTATAPAPPSITPARRAAVRAAALRLLGRSPALGDIAPALQLKLQWLSVHGSLSAP